ncbi:hypothetical protein [Streptomyces bohaiensis]|uniref:Lipoprotein n=1 Tax=Streptomyces bohaiensis TaxID=1431344 RepID=A0ABX1CEW8_9ACTN|nr:hypothetical protein [Streptomyces bohaiensis]NJQ16886.1 hypothetical protein [Streptomyces bohaiensis]
MSSVRRVRRTTATVSAVVCAALVLGACGGGDDDSTDDAIPGVDQSEAENDDEDDTDTEAPEEDADDDADADRPEIDLGDDFENVYEDDETGDEVKDAILRDSRGYFDAVDAAINHQDTEYPALNYYIAGDALVSSIKLIGSMVDSGTVQTGQARIFGRDVTVFEDGAAAVSFCRDFSEVTDVDHATGEVTSAADASAEATIYYTRVELNDQGVWQTVEERGERGAAECN